MGCQALLFTFCHAISYRSVISELSYTAALISRSLFKECHPLADATGVWQVQHWLLGFSWICDGCTVKTKFQVVYNWQKWYFYTSFKYRSFKICPVVLVSVRHFLLVFAQSRQYMNVGGNGMWESLLPIRDGTDSLINHQLTKLTVVFPCSEQLSSLYLGIIQGWTQSTKIWKYGTVAILEVASLPLHGSTVKNMSRLLLAGPRSGQLTPANCYWGGLLALRIASLLPRESSGTLWV